MRYSPSLGCASQLNMIEDIRELKKANIDLLHFDIMDGHYVNNFCLNFELCKEIRQEFPEMELDVHIMGENPMEYISKFAQMGAHWYSFHIDATRFAHKALSSIRENGMKPGIVINPSQSVESIMPIIDMVDMVTLMAIEPGFPGQKFIESTYDKIAELDRIRKQRNLGYVINIDGGLGVEQSKRCLAAGADILILGYFACFGQECSVSEAMTRFDKRVMGEN